MASAARDLPQPIASRTAQAVELIRSVEGYHAVADDLELWQRRRAVRYVATLVDRAQTTLSGLLVIGPEPFDGPLISLGETLVHEHFHRFRQGHLAKTTSFWIGVATRSPVMARYERPAWRAGLAFVRAARAQHAWDALECDAEEIAILRSFEHHYRMPLEPYGQP